MPCIKLGRGDTMRITRLNNCCAPVPGDGNVFVKKNGVVSVEVTSNNEETEELVQNDWTGARCINEPAESFLASKEITSTFCDIVPCAAEIVSGNPPVLDYAGNVSGFSEISGLHEQTRWALELWIAQPTSGPCDPSVEGVWEYVLFPCIGAAGIGDFTVEDGTAITFSWVANTRDHGGAWCRGPYDVVPQDDANTPGKLIEPILPNEHVRWITTTIAPPEPSNGGCECEPLEIDDLMCESPSESPVAFAA